MVAVIVLLLAMIVFIVVVTNAERRIPIQYAKRMVGRKMYGGQSTNLPMKVNMSGVLPVIFCIDLPRAARYDHQLRWAGGGFLLVWRTEMADADASVLYYSVSAIHLWFCIFLFCHSV